MCKRSQSQFEKEHSSDAETEHQITFRYRICPSLPAAACNVYASPHCDLSETAQCCSVLFSEGTGSRCEGSGSRLVSFCLLSLAALALGGSKDKQSHKLQPLIKTPASSRDEFWLHDASVVERSLVVWPGPAVMLLCPISLGPCHNEGVVVWEEVVGPQARNPHVAALVIGACLNAIPWVRYALSSLLLRVGIWSNDPSCGILPRHYEHFPYHTIPGTQSSCCKNMQSLRNRSLAEYSNENNLSTLPERYTMLDL